MSNEASFYERVALLEAEEGQGVQKDYVQAYTLYSLAASRLGASDPLSAKAVKNRDAVASRMTPTQIAEAQRLAREWKPK